MWSGVALLATSGIACIAALGNLGARGGVQGLRCSSRVCWLKWEDRRLRGVMACRGRRTDALQGVYDAAHGHEWRDDRDVGTEGKGDKAQVGCQGVAGDLHQPGYQLQLGLVAEEDERQDCSRDQVDRGDLWEAHEGDVHCQADEEGDLQAQADDAGCAQGRWGAACVSR